MVDLKIQFSKYDYFGILIPGILFLISLILLLPNEYYTNLNEILNTLNTLKIVLIFIIGFGFVVIGYIVGFLLSGLSRWVIEDKIIRNILNYPSYNLFYVNNNSDNLESKKHIFKKYQESYSTNFIKSFNDSFNSIFKENEYDDKDKFMLCFTIVKEKCPVTFGRMNTFLALYGLYRTLSITFLIIFVIYLLFGIIFSNFFLILLILCLPLLGLFCFSNYLKFFRTYADEVFRTFYIYSIDKNKRE